MKMLAEEERRAWLKERKRLERRRKGPKKRNQRGGNDENATPCGESATPSCGGGGGRLTRSQTRGILTVSEVGSTSEIPWAAPRAGMGLIDELLGSVDMHAALECPS